MARTETDEDVLNTICSTALRVPVVLHNNYTDTVNFTLHF